MPVKYFQLYNLIIESTLDFPELKPSKSKKIDLIVREETNPILGILNIQKKGRFHGGAILYEKGQDELLLIIKNVGKFYFKENSEVCFFRFEGVDDKTIRTFILGTCLGFFLIKKGTFAFHASAVQTKFGVVAFVGESGFGKSTMAGIFLNKGHKILTDDVCVIDISDNNIINAFPSLQRIKFWGDSAKELGFADSDLVNIMPGWDKKQLIIDKKNIVSSPKKLIMIYELFPENLERLEIKELKGNEKVLTLMKNIYKVEGVEVFNQEKKHFQFCSKVAQIIPIKQIKRPQNKFELDAIYHSIIHDIQVEMADVSKISGR